MSDKRQDGTRYNLEHLRGKCKKLDTTRHILKDSEILAFFDAAFSTDLTEAAKAIQTEHGVDFLSMYIKAREAAHSANDAHDLDALTKIVFNQAFANWQPTCPLPIDNTDRAHCYHYARSQVDALMLMKQYMSDPKSSETLVLMNRLADDLSPLNGGNIQGAVASVERFMKKPVCAIIAEEWVEKEAANIDSLLKNISPQPKLNQPLIKKLVIDTVAARIEGFDPSGKLHLPVARRMIETIFGGKQSNVETFQNQLIRCVESGIFPQQPTLARPR